MLTLASLLIKGSIPLTALLMPLIVFPLCYSMFGYSLVFVVFRRLSERRWTSNRRFSYSFTISFSGFLSDFRIAVRVPETGFFC